MYPANPRNSTSCPALANRPWNRSLCLSQSFRWNSSSILRSLLGNVLNSRLSLIRGMYPANACYTTSWSGLRNSSTLAIFFLPLTGSQLAELESERILDIMSTSSLGSVRQNMDANSQVEKATADLDFRLNLYKVSTAPSCLALMDFVMRWDSYLSKKVNILISGMLGIL